MSTICTSPHIGEFSGHGLQFVIGFEIEVVFISTTDVNDPSFAVGHAWSSNRALHSRRVLDMIEEIYDSLATSGIQLEQWHSESAAGQYEFVLPPMPPLEAVGHLVACSRDYYRDRSIIFIARNTSSKTIRRPMWYSLTCAHLNILAQRRR